MPVVMDRAIDSRRRGLGWRWEAALLASMLVSAGCDGSSPSAPAAAPPTSEHVVFVDAQAIAAEQATITALLEQTFDRASQALPLGFVRFEVSVEPARAIPGWGIGGYTFGPGDVDIVVDAAYPGLARILPERLPPLAAHELHHTARWQGIGYPYMTLLEAMVTEGLADHFAIELLGAPVPPWCDAFPESQTAQWLARARPELDSAGYDHPAWFFGRGTELPNFAGYTLGYRLVRDYLASQPGSSAASLVHAPAEAFRP